MLPYRPYHTIPHRRCSPHRRTLHWVTKIGSLKNSLRFYELVLGLRVLRHEEFESGCEATCNGPYGGAWSKTMVGLGDENCNFVFELTYNYGVDSYTEGNDLQYIALAMPEAVPRAVALGYPVEYVQGLPVIVGPDGLRYKILDAVAGRQERVLAVGLRCRSLAATKAYWCSVLGMHEFPAPSGLEAGYQGSLCVGWAAGQTTLQFVEVAGGAKVEHALAGGRIANGCRAVRPFYEAALASGQGGVLNPPLTLPTPGKADVEVTILSDPDGYEICFVGDVGFYDLATPLYDKVDWAVRAARGGDGAAPPRQATKHAAAKGMPIASERADVDSLVAGGKLVVLVFGASWCKRCAELAPFCADLATKMANVAFASVDIDEADDLVEAYHVTAVPHMVVLRDGAKVAEYVGSTTDELEAVIAGAVR